MRVEASAPSNIALIKYMGKTSASGNRPANISLSYTLENLRSFVVIEKLGAAARSDEWSALKGFAAIDLSEAGQTKFLTHFRRLKDTWGVEGCHRVLSANNFPSDCGLASSASSFAALTKATSALVTTKEFSPAELSTISREGSGSSCRSFFGPWAKWENDGAEPVDLPLKLEHAVVIVDGGKKRVSSSDAHRRVTGSSNWPGRIDRASQRYHHLAVALGAGDWKAAFEICWAEFWDMHSLFETCTPPFGFMVPDTLMVLNRMQEIWRNTGDGPLVTMDAGANVHLLLRSEQVNGAQAWLSGLNVLRSWHE